MSHDGVMSEPLLTSRQVAERLGKTVTTVNRMANDGRLKPALEVPGYRGARLFDAQSIADLEDEPVK
jgi:hypothetical protein